MGTVLTAQGEPKITPFTVIKLFASQPNLETWARRTTIHAGVTRTRRSPGVIVELDSPPNPSAEPLRSRLSQANHKARFKNAWPGRSARTYDALNIRVCSEQ
ncbi:hypothetical protein Bbelb_096930 [Branchiostoma belcheri]|nr:hypothetical protein Bbelb_096930 [Branchiostoma belcheri]